MIIRHPCLPIQKQPAHLLRKTQGCFIELNLRPFDRGLQGIVEFEALVGGVEVHPGVRILWNTREHERSEDAEVIQRIPRVIDFS